MNITEQAEIVNLLKLKGFKLEESTPTQLRFRKQTNQEVFELEILVEANSLPVSFTLNGNKKTHGAVNFNELVTYLEKEIN